MARSSAWLLFAALLLATELCRAAASCSISATGPAFGVYNYSNPSPTLADGTVTASCNWVSGGSTTVNLVTSYSTGLSGSYANRHMVLGGSFLLYNIYFDVNFQQIRGDGTGGSQTGGASLTVSKTAPTAEASSTIYGRMPAGQDVPPGTYTDTIVITMTY
jgi:spore coat protein U-like protein